jgi:hypothetical protein
MCGTTGPIANQVISSGKIFSEWSEAHSQLERVFSSRAVRSRAAEDRSPS